MMNSKRWLGGWMHLLAFAVVFAVLGCNRGRSPAQKEDSQASAEEAGQKDVSTASTVDSSEDRSEENAESVQSKTSAPDSSSRPQGVIALETRWENGVLTMPCKVNGLRLRFIFDTGASSVCISSTEALFMLKNGYLDEADIGGSSQAVIANGDIVDSTEIILREVEVGGIVLQDVAATVTHGLDAPLLFGQSAIRQLGTIQIRDGEVTILTGTGTGTIEDLTSMSDMEAYDEEEYKQRGWLVEKDGAWKLADDAPMAAKMEYWEAQKSMYDEAEYKQRGWLVERNGSWYLADNVPIEARLKFYRAEAKYDDVSKMCALGRLYEEGVDVPQDFEESFKWYQRAAYYGDAYAQYVTGYNYQHGRGVKGDAAMAAHWYGEAAAKGQIEAQFQLGLMYAKGEGVSKNEVTALAWYRKAAEKGSVRAQSQLGACYFRGIGVQPNGQQAVYWFTQAANQGDAFSLWSLGLMYEYGEGVPVKKGLALNYYKKAADLGDMSAAKSYQRLLEEKREHDRRVREEREFQQWMRQ